HLSIGNPHRQRLIAIEVREPGSIPLGTADWNLREQVLVLRVLSANHTKEDILNFLRYRPPLRCTNWPAIDRTNHRYLRSSTAQEGFVSYVKLRAVDLAYLNRDTGIFSELDNRHPRDAFLNITGNWRCDHRAVTNNIEVRAA